jgi:hypothetical protein
MFPNLNIFKFTKKYPDGRTRDQIDRTLLDRRFFTCFITKGPASCNKYILNYKMKN